MIRFNYFKTKENFDSESPNINAEDISFIEDTKQIYTHGTSFGNENSGGGGGLLWTETISDDLGMITIEELEGYRFLEAVSFNNNQPLNVIRFGNNLYVGYYGGASIPSPTSPVDLLFTSIPNNTVYLCYAKI